MATVGRALLIIAFGVALYGVAVSILGHRTRIRRYTESGRRAMYAVAGLAIAAFAILEGAFLRSDFHYALVATHSSTTTPTFYKATAVWASQEGSLLLWLLLLSLGASLVLRLTRNRVREIVPVAQAVLLGLGAFFAGLLVFSADPFAQLAAADVPVEGTGLNPLLQHGSMMIHPPMLYGGYTLFAVPFAFGVGALVTRRVGSEWIAVTRRFALVAWLLLGVGILLGARWSYTELGWGGYWAWDPVENASLMPWLIGTAFIHSIMLQEKRGMLKVWNASLCLATGTLAIIGTFLVRSGILNSIHAFVSGASISVPFLTLIGVMIAGSTYLVISRAKDLRSEHKLDSLWSREAMFLAQNVVLTVIAFLVFWGTFFPLISKALGNETSLGPPWFDDWIVPVVLILVLLTGIGPLIAWRRATLANVRRNLLVPAMVAVVTLGVLVFGVSGTDTRPAALILFALAAFVLAAVGQELIRGVRARRMVSHESPPVALVSLVRRNRRRYGGYLVHAGIAVLFVGVAASSSFKHQTDATLKPGQTASVGGYTVRYVRPTADPSPRRLSFGAILDVSKGGKHVATLNTSRGFYPSQDGSLGPIGRFFGGEAESQVGLKTGARRDIWAVVNPDLTPLQGLIQRGNAVFLRAMQDLGQGGAARARAGLPGLLALRDRAVSALTERFVNHPWAVQFRLIVSPLVMWIWIGALIAISGGLIAVWPAPAGARRERAALRARVAQELGARP